MKLQILKLVLKLKSIIKSIIIQNIQTNYIEYFVDIYNLNLYQTIHF